MSIFAAPALMAVDEKTAPAPPKNKAAEEADSHVDKIKLDESAPIAVKNKSSFNLEVGTRNPFWPLSWKPAGKVSSGSAGSSQGDVPPGAFVVSTITVDGATHFAIINGKSMQEGQQFGLQVGTQIYQVMVKRIEDGQVVLTRGDVEIVVPLRRK
jgi:hypothetical protein